MSSISFSLAIIKVSKINFQNNVKIPIVQERGWVKEWKREISLIDNTFLFIFIQGPSKIKWWYSKAGATLKLLFSYLWHPAFTPSLHLYFLADDTWYITRDLFDEKGKIRSGKKEEVLLPEIGWEFFDESYLDFDNCKTTRLL